MPKNDLSCDIVETTRCVISSCAIFVQNCTVKGFGTTLHIFAESWRVVGLEKLDERNVCDSLRS